MHSLPSFIPSFPSRGTSAGASALLYDRILAATDKKNAQMKAQMTRRGGRKAAHGSEIKLFKTSNGGLVPFCVGTPAPSHLQKGAGQVRLRAPSLLPCEHDRGGRSVTSAQIAALPRHALM